MTRGKALIGVAALALGVLAGGACSRRRSAPESSSPSGASAALSGSAAPAYEGFHEATTCTFVYAWVWDMNAPDTTVDVEVHVDGKLDATLTAGDFRKDLLAAKKGNGKHSLSYAVPAALRDGKPHEIRMQASKTNYVLRDSPKTLNCAP